MEVGSGRSEETAKLREWRMVKSFAAWAGTLALLPAASSFHAPTQAYSRKSVITAHTPSDVAEPVSTARTPKVGAPMPEGKRPGWFHVPAPGGPASKFQELKVRVTHCRPDFSNMPMYTGSILVLSTSFCRVIAGAITGLFRTSVVDLTLCTLC